MLLSTEDMILALTGQFKQLSLEPEKFNCSAPASQRSWVRIPLSHLNFSGSRDNCLNCPVSARIMSSVDLNTALHITLLSYVTVLQIN